MKWTAFQTFLEDEKIYSSNDLDLILEKVTPYLDLCYTNQKVKYFDIPCAFDIETTSFFQTCGNEQEKVALMYEWTFGLFGLIIIGRTWEDFTGLIIKLSERLCLNERKRLIVYVHNLNFEFQFIYKMFNWVKVFAIDSRKPVYALTDLNIEFRCSYLLSGYSLAKLGDELQKYKVKKLVGNLNYSKLRHSETPLTDREIAYCVNDVKVVLAYIAEKIQNDGNIMKIPLTKTGYVRNFCRNKCFYEDGKPRKKSFKRLRYKEVIKGLTLDLNEYEQLKRAFQGGFTHANPFCADRIIENVTSYDFTSSYPTVMLAEKYPMGKAEKVEIKTEYELKRNMRLYCCIFDIEFFNLQPKVYFENYLSESRCIIRGKSQINNGRVVYAEDLITTITEQDYIIIKQMYTWDYIKIANFRRYKKEYLPTDFVKAILKLYHDKTTLKGVEGKEVEYIQSKEMLNSCYGMTVTDIIREENTFTNHWLEKDEKIKLSQEDKEKKLNEYNKNAGRFMFYPWGVYVTAYARRNLFTGILECGEDYVYSDTDSIKIINAEKHLDYINKYNETITKQLKNAMDFHGISFEETRPKNKKGIEKPLGVWDFDGNYSRFKTLGAKRYLVEYSQDKRNDESDRGKVKLTVAGLNKQTCIPYLCRGWCYDLNGKEYNSPFERFSNNMYIPPAFTGKMTHTYIDDEKIGVITDYTGKPYNYKSLSGIHLMNAEYSLSLSKEYADYIRAVQDDTI